MGFLFGVPAIFGAALRYHRRCLENFSDTNRTQYWGKEAMTAVSAVCF
jgi:hypothetical protein